MANPVSARYAEAAFHKFPNATPADIVVLDRSDGAGPQLTFWNTAIGPQMTEAEVTTEIGIIDAQAAESSLIKNDPLGAPYLNLLRTGTRDAITAFTSNNIRSDTIGNVRADTVSMLNRHSLALALILRRLG